MFSQRIRSISHLASSYSVSLIHFSSVFFYLKLMSVSRVYADVVSNMPEGYADYDVVDIEWQ